MKAIILKCPPGGRYHFGNIALDENTSLDDTSLIPHSDTLFSAIIVTINRILPGRVEDFINYFKKGEIKISSGCFNLCYNERNIYFFPKPILYNLLSKTNHKEARKVSFLSKGVWEKGLLPDQWWNSECILIKNKFVLLKEELAGLPQHLLEAKELPALFSVNTLPKVKVHSPSMEEGYFNQTSVQIADLRKLDPALRVNYFFLTEENLSEEDSKIFESVLKLLADEGIGGERSVGCGQIDGCESLPFSWSIPESKIHATLSLFNPSDAEDLKACRHYQVVLRGGRKTSLRKTPLQRIRMIREGAVLHSTVLGNIPAIDDGEGKFLRNGVAFTAPLPQNVVNHEAI